MYDHISQGKQHEPRQKSYLCTQISQTENMLNDTVRNGTGKF